MNKKPLMVLSALMTVSVSMPALAYDATLRYSQLDSAYEYKDSDTKNDVSFSGVSARLTGDLPSYNLKGVYGEAGYLSESDTPYKAEMIDLGVGATRNFYRNNNFYVDGSLGVHASKYDADNLSDSIYYVGVPAKAQFGLQYEAMRAFVELGYRQNWAVNRDSKDVDERVHPSSMGGLELGAGVRYNFNYGWWSPKKNR